MLTRLFPAFPGGWSGMALLLFRAVLSIALLLEARACFSAGWGALAPGLVGLSSLASALLLLVGFLTPIAGFLGGLGCVFVALSDRATTTPMIFDSRQAVVFAVTMLVGVTVLGPGAFSVDARLFGRREIIIPQSNRPPQRGG